MLPHWRTGSTTPTLRPRTTTKTKTNQTRNWSTTAPLNAWDKLQSCLPASTTSSPVSWKNWTPAAITFPIIKVEVPISYDQHELPYLRINARYLADDPELNPRLMATLHTRTDGPLAEADITVSTVVTYTPLREQDQENR